MSKDYKDELRLWLEHEYGDAVIPEHRFHESQDGEKKRMWRFDYAIDPERLRVAVEFNGMFGGMAHRSVNEAIKDAEKINTAQIQGWIVVQVNTPNLRDGSGYQAITKAVEARRESE